MDDQAVERDIVVAIRRIMRAVDRHSRWLAESYGLTGSQVLLLQELLHRDGITTGELARRTFLAQPTVSEILEHLEDRGLVARKRSEKDLRKVEISVTADGRALIERKPSLLQERFASELRKLALWERHFILAALERVAEMMHAEELEAAPILSSGPAKASARETAEFLKGDAADST